MITLPETAERLKQGLTTPDTLIEAALAAASDDQLLGACLAIETALGIRT